MSMWEQGSCGGLGNVCQEEVRDFLRQKSEFADKVEVERVCVEGGSRTRWWFWVKGEEEVLARLDAVDWGEYWKLQKRSPFLEVATVRVLS